MSRHNSGFTLIEMMMAMTISAIGCALAVGLWLHLHNTIFNRQKIGLENLASQASFLALQTRVSRAQEFLFQNEQQVIWENMDRSRDTLLWISDSLYLNGRVAMPCGISSLQFIAHGPTWKPDTAASNENWQWLDLDRNNTIDGRELDADYSRSLDANEMQFLTLLEMAFTASDGTSYRIRKAMR
jgi:prepilin-type N-terminal cleavage/methylation domain-containing protein